MVEEIKGVREKGKREEKKRRREVFVRLDSINENIKKKGGKQCLESRVT